MPRPGRLGAALACGLALVAAPATGQVLRTTLASYSTASATFVDVPGGSLAVTPGSAAEIWIVLVSARLSTTEYTSDADTGAEVQLVVGGVPRGLQAIRNSGASPGGSVLFFDRITGTTAPQLVKLQLRDGQETATLSNLQILAFRLPTGADFQYVETLGIQQAPDAVWTPMQALTFTPSSPGDYLVMALVSGREDAALSTPSLRLIDPFAAEWPLDLLPADSLRGQFENGRSGWPPLFLARVQTLAASPQTYTIEAHGDNPYSEIRDTRIMAFRTDAFDNAESVEDVAVATPTSSTTPVVKSVLNTTAPPAEADHIIIQSLMLKATGSTTDAHRAGFERNDTQVAGYDYIYNSAENAVSYGFFDAVTTSSSLKLENTYSVSNGAYSVTSWESTIHVLRLAASSCCTNLQTSTTASTITVTAPSAFEMTFDQAFGGSLKNYYDLAEDPSKTYDLPGRAALNLHGLFHSSVATPTLYTTGTNATGAKLQLLESTPTRVKVRQESFFERVPPATGILAGPKGFGDYSVYPQRVAVRWNRKSTSLFNTSDHALEITAHYEAAGPLNNIAGYHENGTVFPATPPTDDDWVMWQRNTPGVRTDFLAILSEDWAAADTLTSSPTGAYMSYRDTSAVAVPAGTGPYSTQAGETWAFLVHYKPTDFVDHNDAAVTSRRADYRTPDVLTVTAPATGWFDASEKTSAGDYFNEWEAAYALEADPATGITFQIDGDPVNKRREPFFKIRQWRSISDPYDVTLDATPLVNGVDYHADVKPLSRAYKTNSLVWHCTLESTAACTPPSLDVGSGGSWAGGSAVDARYGKGFPVTGTSDTFTAAAADFGVGAGAVEFWYRPNYASSSATAHMLWYNLSANDYYRFEHNAGPLLFEICVDDTGAPGCGGTSYSVTVAAASYSWRAREWVHLRAEWSGSGLSVLVNGVVVGSSGTFSAVGLTNGTTVFGSCTAAGCPGGGAGRHADGEIDEPYIYSGLGASGNPQTIGFAGYTASSSEALASSGTNVQLLSTRVDASKRGTHLLFGADSKFRGLNARIATMGTGVATNAVLWEYWNGTGWTSLTATDDTASFTRHGSVYWAQPGDWAPYSVQGGPDLYYVRAYLSGAADYTVAPVESQIKTDILLFQYCGEITALGQTFVFGALATAVELASFEAVAGDAEVTLEWETGSELSNLGFHVYRATSPSGPYGRVTGSMIPGLGSSPLGARYVYRDVGLVNGTTYYYRLEDVESTGATQLHGPVSATPRPAAPPPAPPAPEAPPPEPPPAATITYGDPSQVSLSVLERGRHGVVLELVTGGFHATPLPDGTVRLSVPGFETLSEPGLPALPVKRTAIQALVGRGVRIASVRARDVETFSSLRPPDAGVPALALGADGTPRAAQRRAARRAWRGAYPDPAARLGSVAFQGDAKKAFVELAPLRWDGRSGQLLLARRLVVRIVFAGREPDEVGDGFRGRRRRPRAPGDGVFAHLATRESGLHAVRFGDVLPKQRRPLAPSGLHLAHQGTAVPFFVDPDPSRFGPGSTLYFLSAGPSANPYGDEAVYELSLGAAGRLMEQASAAPAGLGLASAHTWRRFEQDRYYLPSLSEAPDPWLWEQLRWAATVSVAFELTSVAPGTAHLELRLQGVTDYPGSPDHHVRAFVNGALAGEGEWDGMTAHTLELDLAPGVLLEGSNTLTLENVPDAPAGNSFVYLDRFAVRHPRRLQAESGRFDAEFDAGGQATVAGLGPAILLDVSDGPVWLSGGVAGTAGFAFRTEAGHAYLATDRGAVHFPEVRPVAASPLHAATHQADYLLLAPRAWLPELDPLLQRRRAGGLTAMAVAIEEIYEHFGHGEARPEAIRDFLAYAYHEWSAPAPRYALLLGDASFDTRNLYGLNPPDPVPTMLVKTPYLWTASDPSLALINGEDPLPDLAIGRLTARSALEARAAVAKILAWEGAGFTLAGDPAVLVADNPDAAGPFQAHAEELAGGVLAGREVEEIYLAELGAVDARARVKAAFERGTSLMSYIGHGAARLWAAEALLSTSDVASLTGQPRQPLVLAMNCLNAYFHVPAIASLAEALVNAEGRGAIAAISSSGLSANGSAHAYHSALLTQLEHGGHARLGDALLAAQAAYVDAGGDPDLLAIFHLLGDPALEIR